MLGDDRPNQRPCVLPHSQKTVKPFDYASQPLGQRFSTIKRFHPVHTVLASKTA